MDPDHLSPETLNWTRDQATDALVDAIINGKDAAARYALKCDADIHFNFDQALRVAASKKNEEILRLLVAEGADIHALNDEALRTAVRENSADMVKLLLKLGADPDANDGYCLIQAAKRGFFTVVQMLLDAGADPNRAEGQALRAAAFAGKFAIVQELVLYGADPFADNGAAAALAWAENQFEIEAYLGKVMDERRESFRQDLYTALNTAAFLRNNYCETGEAAFVRAAKMGCLNNAVTHFRDKGGQLTSDDLLNLKDKQGRSFVALAVTRGELGLLFDAALWKEDAGGMSMVWNALPEAARAKGGLSPSDFESQLAQCRVQSLKKKFSGFKLKPG